MLTRKELEEYLQNLRADTGVWNGYSVKELLDSHLSALDRIEELVLELAVAMTPKPNELPLWNKPYIDKLEHNLALAVEALKKMTVHDGWENCYSHPDLAKQTLQQIGGKDD